MKGLTILGATGTIGINTLDVVARHPDRFRVVALTANANDERLFEQCRAFRPEYAVMVDADAAQRLDERLRQAGLATRVLAGVAGLESVAALAEVDYVMAAIVGAAGLRPCLAAARSGKRILLANKEVLVMSGRLFMDEVKAHGAELLPIDSEHNAIFQCLPENKGSLAQMGVDRILLTASGGPFRGRRRAQLEGVTPEQAVSHPNWVMGRKISVDSATLMNKGLELIEACWLFDATVSQVEVVLHPQSIIHSLVSYVDGSVLAQMGNPDMRTPIAHALAWPERVDAGVEPLDLFKVARLDFEAPDTDAFPCLRLAREAMQAGGTATAILNAANEVAVDAFLSHRAGFLAIPAIVEDVLGQLGNEPADSLQKVIEADAAARVAAEALVSRLGEAAG